MLIRARAPLRISFAGDGTDIPPYCDEQGGAVLCATINRYAYATLRSTEDNRFRVNSVDYDATISYGIKDRFIHDKQLELARGVIDHFRRHHNFDAGLEVSLHNDAPPGSGLGSSSALATALVAALRESLGQPADNHAIAESAYQIERLEVGIRGGKQDQYASAFGGFNLIEFQRGAATVNPLQIRQETVRELECSLIFAYIAGQRFSGHILDEQVENYRRRRKKTVNALDKLKKLAYETRSVLLSGDLRQLGKLLEESWRHKRQIAEGISSPWIDELYKAAKKTGASGGKITGAGGGGFMFFYCEPSRRFGVQEKLRRLGAQLVNFSFTKEGVETWRLRQNSRVSSKR